MCRTHIYLFTCKDLLRTHFFLSLTDKPTIHSTDHSTNQVTKGHSNTDKPIIVTQGDNGTWCMV